MTASVDGRRDAGLVDVSGVPLAELLRVGDADSALSESLRRIVDGVTSSTAVSAFNSAV